MATIPRPFNPFVPGNEALISPRPMANQRPKMRPPPPAPSRRAMQSSPMGPPQTMGPIPGMGQVIPPSMMMPQGADASAQPAGGERAPLGQRLRDFAGSDAALAMAAGVLGGGTTGEALGRGFEYAMQARQKPTNDDIRAFQFAKTPEGGGFQGSFVDFMKVGGTGEYGLTPVPFVRDDGSVGYGVTTKSGRFHELDVPGEGIMSPYQRRFDESAGGAAGKGQGEALASYESMTAKLPGLEQVVSQLDQLAETATYTYAGQIRDELRRQTGREPTQAAIDAATYDAMVSNQILPLLRDTFGAQFTEREGQTLRATLGDPNMAPAEKKAALRAFIEQKRRDVEALAQQAGVDTPAPTGPSVTPTTPMSELSDEELRAIIDGP